MLTKEQVDRYWADGFLAIEALIDADEVERLRAAYDEIIDGVVASPTQRMLGGVTRQVMVPSLVHPVFETNGAIEAGREVMRDLLGCAHANRVFDMLIDKPAGHRHETPWHQDASYMQVPTTPAGFRMPLTQVQFWVALDDVDVDNGCMQFVPGRHHDGTATHVVASGDLDDSGRLLAYADVSEAAPELAVACSLRAGGATIHTAMTPHYTGPNTTADRPRRAYIFNLTAADVADDRLQNVLRENYVRDPGKVRVG